MKKKRPLWMAAGAVVMLGVLCLAIGLVGVLVYDSVVRSRAFNTRPLVLIHSPRNRDAVRLGERLLVHATGRAENGLLRLELWANDQLVGTQQAPEAHPSTMILSEDWVPTLEGTHTLVVRAVAANGSEGQATVAVTAVERGASEVRAEGATEGESSSAGEEDGEPPAAEVESSDASGGPEAGEEREAGSEPPPAEEESPDRIGVFQGIFFDLLRELFQPGSEPRTVRVEIPGLRTGQAYDLLHCYVELAGTAPRWYPDEDSDPSTDESFAALGDGWWDSASLLAGDRAPVISWPGNEPIPLVVTCVGVVGGTEAVELGRVELSIPPGDWNGTLHHADATGAEGSFEFSYRVSPGTTLLYLDPDMTPPANARLDEPHIVLQWDYLPEEGELPIDGFRLYLNGNVQWTEPPDRRESALPYEWLTPPCGATYSFAVTAYRDGFPDGPESLPAMFHLSQPFEDCHRQLQVVFQTLETFDLGGDGRHEDRHGDVGPAYGYFFANVRQITFDGGDLGPGLDMPSGLRHNTVYDLSAMSADPAWHFSHMNRMIVSILPGGSFEFGFHIADQDSGTCHDADDPGCDDLICEGRSAIYEDRFGEFDRRHEGSILSDDGRCRLSFSWGPAAGSPVGSGEPGWEPLPWIDVQGIGVDEATGEVRIEVRNTGTATWPWRDLKVELQARDGSSIGLYTWPEFVLEAGQETILEHPDMVLGAPYDACVVIDPLDEVTEEYERSGALIHGPICPRLPDLIITDVRFEPSGGGRVRVTVENNSEAALKNRTLSFLSLLADGSPAYLNRSWPAISLEPHQARSFDLSGAGESVRARLTDGYSITVNPEGTVAEVDLENNTYVVRGSSRMNIRWCTTAVPHYYGWGHTVRMDMSVDALAGTEVRRLLSHRIEDYFSYRYIDTQDTHYLVGSRSARQCAEIGEFDVMGDEQLQVIIGGQYQAGSAGSWDDLGNGSARFMPQSNWGADVAAVCTRYRYSPFETAAGWHDFLVYPDLGMLSPRPWTVTYHLCLESGGE